jgi:hypothetical protein
VDYLSVKEMSNKWEISTRRIQTLCNQNRIKGAKKIGYMWVIPEDAKKPNDARIKSGKYIDVKRKNDKSI